MSGHSYFMLARGGWEAAVPWVSATGCYLMLTRGGWEAAFPWDGRRMGSDEFLDVPDEGAEAEHRAVFVEGL